MPLTTSLVNRSGKPQRLQRCPFDPTTRSNAALPPDRTPLPRRPAVSNPMRKMHISSCSSPAQAPRLAARPRLGGHPCPQDSWRRIASHRCGRTARADVLFYLSSAPVGVAGGAVAKEPLLPHVCFPLMQPIILLGHFFVEGHHALGTHLIGAESVPHVREARRGPDALEGAKRDQRSRLAQAFQA